MNFKYIENTSIIINGKKHTIRMEDGMTGIGSRDYFIDGQHQFWNCLLESDDLTKGNHYIYTIKWRDTPWDKADLIIKAKYIRRLLNKRNEWREPIKRVL